MKTRFGDGRPHHGSPGRIKGKTFWKTFAPVYGRKPQATQHLGQLLNGGLNVQPWQTRTTNTLLGRLGI
ncbi:MAG: hypothetical protein V3S51_04645 [Dehalococcoidia bacterium]